MSRNSGDWKHFIVYSELSVCFGKVFQTCWFTFTNTGVGLQFFLTAACDGISLKWVISLKHVHALLWLCILKTSGRWVERLIVLLQRRVWLLKPVFLNQGSVSGCQGFRRNNFPGTKFATTVPYGCSNIDTWIRGETRWDIAQAKRKFGAHISYLRSFWSKRTLMKKLLVRHWLDFSAPPAIIWRPPQWFSAPHWCAERGIVPPCPPRYTPDLEHYIGFHKQRKRLRTIPLQRERLKNIVLSSGKYPWNRTLHPVPYTLRSLSSKYETWICCTCVTVVLGVNYKHYRHVACNSMLYVCCKLSRSQSTEPLFVWICDFAELLISLFE